MRFCGYLLFLLLIHDCITQYVTTYAGTGSSASVDGPLLSASFYRPVGMFYDSQGLLYFTEGDQYIRLIFLNGTVSTFAGSGSSGSTNGPVSTASFYTPFGIVLDYNQNVYVSDYSTNLIRKISNGTVSTFAGSGSGLRDGTGTNAQFYGPEAMSLDNNGNILIADLYNHRVRLAYLNGTIITLLGSSSGSSDGPISTALFHGVSAAMQDTNGDYYVVDYWNYRIRKVSNGIVSTFAGSSTGYQDGSGTSAMFSYMDGITMDANGNIYVSDDGNYVVRRIFRNGTVTTLAGVSGTSGSHDGPAASATFHLAEGLIHYQGSIYLADTVGNKIRKITLPTVSNMGSSVFYFTANQSYNIDSSALYVPSSGNLTYTFVALPNPSFGTFYNGSAPVSLSVNYTGWQSIMFVPNWINLNYQPIYSWFQVTVVDGVFLPATFNISLVYGTNPASKTTTTTTTTAAVTTTVSVTNVSATQSTATSLATAQSASISISTNQNAMTTSTITNSATQNAIASTSATQSTSSVTQIVPTSSQISGTSTASDQSSSTESSLTGSTIASDSESSSNIILYVSIAGGILLQAIVFVIVYRRRKLKNRNIESINISNVPLAVFSATSNIASNPSNLVSARNEKTGLESETVTRTLSLTMTNVFSVPGYKECTAKDFSINESIGSGGTGVVKEGTALNPSLVSKLQGGSLAVKLMKGIPEQDFLHEIAIMERFRHPNVVEFIGFCRDPHAILMFKYDTSLNEMIKSGNIPAKQALKFASDIAAGLTEIHRKDVIHFDIKPHNVLIKPDENGITKCVITDFGAAAIVHQSARATKVSGMEDPSLFALTIMYAAPELLLSSGRKRLVSSTLDKAIDVYALSITYYEMITLSFLKDILAQTSVQEFSQLVVQGSRPDLTNAMIADFETKCELKISDLLVAAWDPAPKLRPSAKEILEWLNKN